MDLNLIKPFLAVYKYQSITKAADTLDLTQPAVSAALRRLENLLNKKLFVKEGRGITATSSAITLANKLEGAMELIETAVTEKEKIHAYAQEAPLQQISSVNSVIFHEPPIEEMLLIDHLRTQKVDLIIDSIIPEDHAFIVEPLYDEEVAAVCRAEHPRINGALSQEQFYAETHVLYQMKRKNFNGLKFKADRVKKRNIKIEVSSLANVLLTVAKTDYIGACSRTFAEKWAETLNIQVLEYPIVLPKLPMHMVYHRRFLNDPVHTQVREAIKAKLS